MPQLAFDNEITAVTGVDLHPGNQFGLAVACVCSDLDLCQTDQPGLFQDL